MYACNFQLIYHAFALRPYAVLPELMIFNLFLCFVCFNSKSRLLWVLYSVLFYFTCIYHAYGILIALLPLVCNMIDWRRVPYRFIPMVVVSLLCWGYYASYNSFGMIPNAVQTQVSAFEYMPRVGFFNSVFHNLTGGGVVMYGLAGVLLIRCFRFDKGDWSFLGLLVLLPLALIFGVSLISHAWILPRYFIWVFPTFIMFCVMQVEKLVER